jgi:hypothetical protein
MAIPQIQGTIDTNGDAVTLTVRDATVPGQVVYNGGVGIQVTGTWTGTLTFRLTRDGTTYTAFLVTNDATDARASTTTANGVFSANLVGVVAVRVVATATITGAAVVTLIAAEG